MIKLCTVIVAGNTKMHCAGVELESYIWVYNYGTPAASFIVAYAQIENEIS